MEWKNILERRHSIRRFDERQVHKDVLTEIMDEARRSPSWANAQERNIYIATKETAKKIRKEFWKYSQKNMIGISDFSFTHRDEWSARAQASMEQFSNSMERILGDEVGEMVNVQDCLFDAPAICYLTVPKKTSNWALLDLGAFEMSVLLSAADKGLDTMVAYAYVKYPEIVRKYLPISEDEDIAIGIGIGYAKEDAIINEYRSVRVPLDQMLIIKE